MGLSGIVVVEFAYVEPMSEIVVAVVTVVVPVIASAGLRLSVDPMSEIVVAVVTVVVPVIASAGSCLAVDPMSGIVVAVVTVVVPVIASAGLRLAVDPMSGIVVAVVQFVESDHGTVLNGSKLDLMICDLKKQFVVAVSRTKSREN